MNKNMLKSICSISLLCLLLTAGCNQIFYTPVPEQTGNYYINYNLFPGTVRNVALFEFENKSSHLGISDDLANELYSNLQKDSLFGTMLVSRTDPAWNKYRLDAYKAFSQERMQQIKTAMHCDAVLVGTITDYKPWPYMSMGMRLKLIDVRNGQLLWAYENSWDCADVNTKQRMINYFYNNTNTIDSELQKEMLGVSSINFIKFVAHEATSTIMVYNY